MSNDKPRFARVIDPDEIAHVLEDLDAPQAYSGNCLDGYWVHAEELRAWRKTRQPTP